MASEVDICNKALVHVAGNLITSLDDPSKEASLCKLLYPDLRDAVLQAHDWGFAVERAELPKSATSPTFRYANAFPLPGNVLHVLEVNQIDRYDRRRDWQVEDDAIVTDAAECSAKFIVQVVDTSKFSPLFIEALAARLAADLAIPISRSKELEEQKFQLYGFKLSEAAARDNQQGKSKRIRATWLLNARRSSGPQGAGPVV